MNEKENFINFCEKKFNHKYDYSFVDYKNCFTKVKIICPIHGAFEVTPTAHKNSKFGCKKCSFDLKGENISKKNRHSNGKYIKKCIELFGNKYDYSLIEYKGVREKIKVICPIHGLFEPRADTFISKNGGCRKCSSKFNTEYFINRAKLIHGNKYDYSLTEYKGADFKLKIICPKHGVFEQVATAHLSQKQGCPFCKESKGEKIIYSFLVKNNISFVFQKTFDNLKDISKLSYDFYLPNYNLLIEYNGIQHYKPIKKFGGENYFDIQKKHDLLKKEYAEKNNINLLIISYKDIKNISNILKENIK